MQNFSTLVLKLREEKEFDGQAYCKNAKNAARLLERLLFKYFSGNQI